MVCTPDKIALLIVATSLLYVGASIGGLLGSFTDYYGRKPVLIVTIVACLVTNVIAAFTPEVYSYTATKLFIGIIGMPLYRMLG